MVKIDDFFEGKIMSTTVFRRLGEKTYLDKGKTYKLDANGTIFDKEKKKGATLISDSFQDSERRATCGPLAFWRQGAYQSRRTSEPGESLGFRREGP